MIRSLLEVFINTRYILDTNSNKRLILFHLADAQSRATFSSEMLDFTKRYPNFGSRDNQLTNRDFLQKQLDTAQDEISNLKKHYKIKIKNKLPNLLERAKANDSKTKKEKGTFEYNYQTIYRFFSNYAHLTSRGINSFLNPRPDGGYDLITGKSVDIGPAVSTSYAVYLFYLENLMKWHIIKKSSLAKYIKIAKGFSKQN